MDLGLSESQKMLRASARNFLRQECPSSLVRDMEEDPRGYTSGLWSKMATLGWLGLVIPERLGGAGADFTDLVVLLEEMGRSLLPGPFFSTIVLGTLPILEFGTEGQQKACLPPVARGEIVLTAALTEPSATYEPYGITLHASANDKGFLLNGTKLFVPDAHVANTLLVPSRTTTGDEPEEGITVFLVSTRASGYSTTALSSVGGDKQYQVTLEDVELGPSAILGAKDQGWAIVKRLREWAATGTCALMVGNAAAVLDMTVAYVKERTQFGKPVGSFQAIQHHCANMATDVAGARYVTYQAAWKLAMGQDATQDVSIAKAWVSWVNQRAVVLAHECHGAIGFTWEHDLSLYTRRAKAWELQYGGTDFHRELVAQTLGL